MPTGANKPRPPPGWFDEKEAGEPTHRGETATGHTPGSSQHGACGERGANHTHLVLSQGGDYCQRGRCDRGARWRVDALSSRDRLVPNSCHPSQPVYTTQGVLAHRSGPPRHFRVRRCLFHIVATAFQDCRRLRPLGTLMRRCLDSLSPPHACTVLTLCLCRAPSWASVSRLSVYILPPLPQLLSPESDPVSLPTVHLVVNDMMCLFSWLTCVCHPFALHAAHKRVDSGATRAKGNACSSAAASCGCPTTD